MKRKINVKAKAKAHVAVEKAQAARHVTVKKDEPKGKGLFFFQMTPAGDLLRAYFVALIRAQIGKLEAGKPFKLWPAANLVTHTANGRLKRQGKAYILTAQGVNYFSDEKQAPAKEVVEQMLGAVKTGERPACYKYEMSPLTK
jgi:hypothetical protein